MSPDTAVPTAPRPLRLTLTIPSSRLGFGPLQYDPVAALLGAPLSHFLQPLLAAPPSLSTSQSGAPLDVFPLLLPPGVGLALRLGTWGDVGLRNLDGNLLLILPWLSLGAALPVVSPWLVAPATRHPSSDLTSFNAHLPLALPAGAHVRIPLALLGEIGLAVG